MFTSYIFKCQNKIQTVNLMYSYLVMIYNNMYVTFLVKIKFKI